MKIEDIILKIKNTVNLADERNDNPTIIDIVFTSKKIYGIKKIKELVFKNFIVVKLSKSSPFPPIIKYNIILERKK